MRDSIRRDGESNAAYVRRNGLGLCGASQHQLRIARKTMKLSCVGAAILGGPNHYEAAEIIHRLTGVFVAIDAPCSCRRADGA